MLNVERYDTDAIVLLFPSRIEEEKDGHKLRYV